VCAGNFIEFDDGYGRSSENGLFDTLVVALLKRTKKVWQLALYWYFVFFSQYAYTNDVALITFVPFAILTLKKCGQERLVIPVVVLQTIAANLGSMLTPIGNPQNLYLYNLSQMGFWSLCCLCFLYNGFRTAFGNLVVAY